MTHKTIASCCTVPWSYKWARLAAIWKRDWKRSKFVLFLLFVVLIGVSVRYVLQYIGKSVMSQLRYTVTEHGTVTFGYSSRKPHPLCVACENRLSLGSGFVLLDIATWCWPIYFGDQSKNTEGQPVSKEKISQYIHCSQHFTVYLCSTTWRWYASLKCFRPGLPEWHDKNTAVAMQESAKVLELCTLVTLYCWWFPNAN